MLRSSTISLALLCPLLVAPVASHAQHAPGYAQFKDRDIKALSAQQVADLREGRGMGLSLPAELNGIPGPLHVLELRESLALTEKQASEVGQIRDKMKSAAQSLGASILEAEGRLEQLFRSGKADEVNIKELTAVIGRLNASLRDTHLLAHVQTRQLMTNHQVTAYNRARGYTSEQGGNVAPTNSHGHHPGSPASR